ncbi:hypothetical protein GCM10028828_20580 [Corynebacterium tapiri]
MLGRLKPKVGGAVHNGRGRVELLRQLSRVPVWERQEYHIVSLQYIEARWFEDALSQGFKVRHEFADGGASRGPRGQRTNSQLASHVGGVGKKQAQDLAACVARCSGNCD